MKMSGMLAASGEAPCRDRKSTRLNSSHRTISYAVFCLKKKKIYNVIAGDLLTETLVFVEFVFVFQRTVEQGFKIVNSLELLSFREQETFTIFLDRLLVL